MEYEWLAKIYDSIAAGSDGRRVCEGDNEAMRFADFVTGYRKSLPLGRPRRNFNLHGHPVIAPGNPPVGSDIEKNVVINRYLHSKDTVMQGSMTVAVSYDCDSTCRQCYVSKFFDPTKVTLTVEQFGSLFRKITGEAYVWHIDITGGEPLENPDFFRIIDRIPSDKATAIVATNGLALDEETVARIREANIMICKVSINSSIKARHDGSLSNEKIVKRAMEGIGRLLDNNIFTFVQTYVQRDCRKSRQLERVIEDCKRLGVDSVHVVTPLLTGNLKEREDLLLTPLDREYLYALQRKYWTRDRFRIGVFPDWELEQGGCAAARHRIYITPYGEVYPCNFYNIKSYGNIITDDLRGMIEEMHRDIPEMPQECIASNINAFILKSIREWGTLSSIG